MRKRCLEIVDIAMDDVITVANNNNSPSVSDSCRGTSKIRLGEEKDGNKFIV